VNGNAYIGGSATAAGGTGMLNVQQGAMTVTGTLKLWNSGAAAPAGTRLTLSGGLLSVGSLDTSGNPARVDWSGGTLNLSNSSLTVGTGGQLGSSLVLGTGKSLQVSSPSAGVTVGGGGTLSIEGGSLITPTLANQGSFSFTGGSLDLANSDSQVNATGLLGSSVSLPAGKNLSVSGTTMIGAGAALTVSGGGFTTQNLVNNGGAFSINATNVTVPGAITLLGGTIDGTTGVITAGSYAVQSGSISAALGGSAALTKSGSGTVTLSGANSYSGGTSVAGGTLIAGHSEAFANGALDIADGAKAQVQSGLANAVVVTTLNTHSTGQMDITNGAMVIRGSTPSAVFTQIQSGFNGGAWNGGGINSSAAAADANGLTAIGWASNADFGASGFKGVSGLTANDVLVRYTYYGDADLTGNVTLDDFSQFLNGYQTQSPATDNWLNGDFDYDGAVTLDDFSQFLFGYQNQGAPLGALESMIESSGLSSFEKSMMLAAVEAVPEPTGLALLGLAGVGLVARRRVQA
jgi:autotransporter-associated beta strand protein